MPPTIPEKVVTVGTANPDRFRRAGSASPLRENGLPFGPSILTMAGTPEEFGQPQYSLCLRSAEMVSARALAGRPVEHDLDEMPFGCTGDGDASEQADA